MVLFSGLIWQPFDTLCSDVNAFACLDELLANKMTGATVLWTCMHPSELTMHLHELVGGTTVIDQQVSLDVSPPHPTHPVPCGREDQVRAFSLLCTFLHRLEGGVIFLSFIELLTIHQRQCLLRSSWVLLGCSLLSLSCLLTLFEPVS